MKLTTIIVLMVFALIAGSCNQNSETNTSSNPHAEGFNVVGSDEKAIEIANEVMEAMGGRNVWDTTSYFKWNFFGRRHLVWDKQTGNVRIDSPGDSLVYLINVKQDTGSVYVKNEPITSPDSLGKMVARGKSIWINDSYWLFMPFKLKDSGVTLSYLREDTLKTGVAADVLQLTFEGVGDTPQNKYEVYVDKSDNLVKQWAYFADSSQETPSAVWPWDNYQTVSGLKLSFDRSDNKGPRDVKVFNNLSEEIFTNPEKPDWSKNN